MIRERVEVRVRELAMALGAIAEGSQWHIFGSVDRDEPGAADIDLLVLCNSDVQADEIRRAIDPDALELPLHLSLMTFEEAEDADAIRTQASRAIFPDGANV